MLFFALQCILHHVCIDLSDKSAEVIVLEAFGAHFLKEIGRNQLLSAAKSFVPPKERKSLCNTAKMGLVNPLARAFLNKRNIIEIKSGKRGNRQLTRNDVSNIGTF